MQQEQRSLKVHDIGEQGLLKLVQAYCPPDLVGDDAAVLTPHPGRSLVITADMLVDGVHFSDQTTPPADAGWRAVAANLSDLAAMGAIPMGITVSLGLPGDTAVDWVERLYEGMTECLQCYNTVLVGGDICRSPVLTIAITAFGEAMPTHIIQRSQAQPGDAIVVTGPHGSSRAGLELLLHPELRHRLSSEDQAHFIQAHQRPKPRLDMLDVIWQPELWQQPAASAAQSYKSDLHSVTCERAIAGMDSSDGLADAVLQLCRASGVGARIDRNLIAIAPSLIAWVGTNQALDWALYGGEDFELVLCLPPTIAQRLVARLGSGVSVIGTITSEPEVWLIDPTGEAPESQLTLKQGFQHF